MKATQTKSDLLQRNAALSKDNDVLSLALNDVVNLGAKWFGNSRQFSIGITRPNSACGGICIVRRSGTVSAYYFEEFAQAELSHIAIVITGENTDHNRDLLCRRAAIESAHAYIREQQKAA